MVAMQKFSATKRITKKNLAGVPVGVPGVYRIRNADGRLLYVGVARQGRLGEDIERHKGKFSRGKFHKGTQFQFRVTKDRRSADVLEREEIKRFMVRSNRVR